MWNKKHFSTISSNHVQKIKLYRRKFFDKSEFELNSDVLKKLKRDLHILVHKPNFKLLKFINFICT